MSVTFARSPYQKKSPSNFPSPRELFRPASPWSQQRTCSNPAVQGTESYYVVHYGRLPVLKSVSAPIPPRYSAPVGAECQQRWQDQLCTGKFCARRNPWPAMRSPRVICVAPDRCSAVRGVRLARFRPAGFPRRSLSEHRDGNRRRERARPDDGAHSSSVELRVWDGTTANGTDQ